MSEKTVVYQTFYNPIEANIVYARLQDAGFQCFLADENISVLQPLYNQAIGGVKLIIFENDKTAIDLILAEDNVIEEDKNQNYDDKAKEDDLLCMRCGSTNVAFGQATKKRFSLWVTLLSLILLVYPFKANKCFHCYDCGHEFN